VIKWDEAMAAYANILFKYLSEGNEKNNEILN
jgi:hypothetical protein